MMDKSAWLSVSCRDVSLAYWDGTSVLSYENDQDDGYFGTDHVILNQGKMTKTTAELTPPSSNFRTTPAPPPAIRPYTRLGMLEWSHQPNHCS
ncbi:hypothetical protein AVEN_179797-1 [Araneus ventricosus]|uniref:Uncharacterized protein n=1 Tax=Araneus ventricosus TaxID=182803 RepID=A0A4Y2G0C4_ARAVE|nr:hypothetical protein AVEN_179797-1 [Araneus ventricosus]